MEAEIKVVIVEDTEVLRDSLTMLLKGSHGFNLTGVYENAEDALLHLPNLCPDVVLMDIGLPGINGIECIKQLEGKCPNTQFLICTIYEEDEYVFEALKAGATGYILKNSSPAMILDSIIELHKGGAPMSRLIARKVIQTMQKPKVNKELELLTPRENEVLILLSEGFRYKEIADQINIDKGTVQVHIHNIYEKLQVQSRTDALNKAYPR